MSAFQVSQFNSKQSSIITGSLNISGSLTSVFGTASYVDTSSYTILAATASYTTILTVPTSSYSLNSISSSFALTSSIAQGPKYLLNPSIGFLNPNIYFGTPGARLNMVAAEGGGVHYSPIQITRTCTVTTMSGIFSNGGTAGTTMRFAIYSHSTSSFLPEFRLTERSASFTINGATVISMSLTSPLQLNSDTIYWIAVSFGGTQIQPLADNAPGLYAQVGFAVYNNLLYQRYNVGAFPISAAPVAFNGSPIIKSGSTYGAVFNPTASQILSDYSPFPRQPYITPFLKITY